jgi:hypothetical protein
MTINWVLAESSRMRYAAGSSMYFAQGIPYGLMNIAVPAWLASEGVGAGQIASFLAVIILPWAFKLLSGPHEPDAARNNSAVPRLSGGSVRPRLSGRQ